MALHHLYHFRCCLRTFSLGSQTLFDAHFLVSIARQHQLFKAAASSDSVAMQSDDHIVSLDCAMAALTEQLRQRLDVVAYRSGSSPLTNDCFLLRFCFLMRSAGSSLHMLWVPLLPLPLVVPL
jgi:hypothetical protein